MTTNPLPGLHLRAMQPNDAEALAELQNLPHFRWGTLRLPFQTPVQMRSFIEKIGGDMLGLVAVAEGRIVGSASLQRFAGRRAHAGSVGMGVHDGWTRRGVGAALLMALLDTADNWWGLRRVELTVWTDNAPALALYRRFGFVIEGTHRAFAFRDGQFVDAHAMARLNTP